MHGAGLLGGRVAARLQLSLGAITLASLVACSGAKSSGPGGDPDDPATNSGDPADPASDDDKGGSDVGEGTNPGVADDVRLEPPPITKTSLRENAAGVAWVFEKDREPRKLKIDQAEARGFAVVDLSDQWRPYIFSAKTPGRDDAADNRYAERYLGLANDEVDRDGDELSASDHNYLELYGIPPTLSVVLTDWKASADDLTACLEAAKYDPAPFQEFEGVIAFSRKTGKKRLREVRWQKASLDKAMKKAKVPAGDYAAAAEHPDTKAQYERWHETDLEVQVIANAQKRFRCEGLFESHGGKGKFTLGEYDGATSHALAAFEKKHDIMGWGHFKKENVAALAKPPEELAYDRMVRVITERAVSSRGIVEDGSAAQWKPKFRWKDAKGKEHALRDLVSESTDATLAALGLDDVDSARDRLEQLSELATEGSGKGGDNAFDHFLVAVRMPALPSYYSQNMDFEAVIDRGDVWYEFPYDDEGNKRGQPRKRYPHLTVYTNYEGQRIPLVHWRTTIGSWRSEEHEGKEYFAYKNSDVGSRVWKDIMAAPVWLPPASTPTRTLVKRKAKHGKWRTVVNYDETGPSFTSAYGLVAAYHIRQRKDEEGNVLSEFDNQIRTHGSVDYMSILRRYSHGCHRLYNMNAVRLFSFILQHRDYVRHGQTEVGFARMLQHEGNSYRMALDTRGYRYELEEPIHVEVTEGHVRGSRSRPYEDLMPKPGVIYEDEEAQSAEALAPIGGELPTVPFP